MSKGQAAIEFLITYGWAILIVITAVGALAYFGVLSPGRLLSEQCIADATFVCMGKAYSNSTNTVFVLSSISDFRLNLTNTSARIPKECSSLVFCDKGGSACGATRNVDPRGEFMVKMACKPAGNRERYDVSLGYNNLASGLNELADISIVTKIKD